MQVKTEQYIYPPRPADCLPRDQTSLLGKMGWLAQLKYNDSRCLIKFLPEGKTELWSRHAQRIRNYTVPDWLQEQINKLPGILGLSDGIHLLDGGILDGKHKAIKDTLVIWDILVKDGEHLLGSNYADRYNLLNVSQCKWSYAHPNGKTYQLGIALTDNILIPQCHPADKWEGLWEMIDEINTIWTVGKPTDKNYQCHPLIEGLVFKNPRGTLGMGFTEKNNSDWLMRSRVTTGRHKF